LYHKIAVQALSAVRQAGRVLNSGLNCSLLQASACTKARQEPPCWNTVFVEKTLCSQPPFSTRATWPSWEGTDKINSREVLAANFFRLCAGVHWFCELLLKIDACVQSILSCAPLAG
jgi:hypothetical protein